MNLPFTGTVRAAKVRRIINSPDRFVVEASTSDGAYLVNSRCGPDSAYRSELTNGLCKREPAVLLFTEAKEGTKEAAADDQA